MTWAGRRRFSIALGIVLGFAVITAGVWYFFIYTPPSCNDGLLNQDERGIDCEGTCARMCTVPRVDALWSRSVKTAEGVYHGVALIKNPLPNAAGAGLAYTMSLYDSGNILVAERRGTFDIKPGETRVIFEPNVVTGERVPVRAFMKIDGGTWERAVTEPSAFRVIPGVVDEETLTLTATIENVTPAPISDVIADALLFDEDGILVTASESQIPLIPPRGRHEVIFTWQEPFARPVITTDVVVRINGRP